MSLPIGWLIIIVLIGLGLYSCAETMTAERNYKYYGEPAR